MLTRLKAIQFLMSYPSVQNTQDTPTLPRTSKVSFVSVLVWICFRPSKVGAISPPTGSSTLDNPLIVLVCSDVDVYRRLSTHLDGNARRLARLKYLPHWIYLDLSNVFSSWSETWNMARFELRERDNEIMSNFEGTSSMEITRMLHEDAAHIIGLGEDIRIHIRVAENYKRAVAKIFDGQGEMRLYNIFPELFSGVSRNDAEIEKRYSLLLEFGERLDNAVESLLHMQETSNVILRQLENLLSLVSCPPLRNQT